MSDLLQRIAGGPITWGVTGSPETSYQMDRDRVVREMAQAGLSATELGPDGFLPADPALLREYVSQRGLRIAGGFVPAVLHRQERFEADLDYFERASRQLAAVDGGVLVVGPDTHLADLDTSIELDEPEWQTLVRNLGRLQQLAASHALRTALHPHWGMSIERAAHVERVMDASDVELCLDTGHLFLGGADPVEIARRAPQRVAHVHLKDVRADLAAHLLTGTLTFDQAVRQGLFVPLGQGAVDIDGVIEVLEGSGFKGWYVLEQDTALEAEPAAGEGPFVDARLSVDYLAALVSS
ncbi:MAG: TIM barrel protein [Candidatus Limnocylindrales bacterium]